MDSPCFSILILVESGMAKHSVRELIDRIEIECSGHKIIPTRARNRDVADKR